MHPSTPSSPPPPPPRLPSRRGKGAAGVGRRALPALVLTGASGLLLAALDRPGGSAGAAADDVVAAPAAMTPASSATTIVPATNVPATSAPTTIAGTATTAAGAGSSTASTDSTASTASTAPSSTVPAAPVCTTVDGPTIDTRWGPVQVEASVTADGQVCAVDAIVTPNDHRKSVAINDRAVPVLDDRALAAQSADFDGVSGATITSNAYKQSLQAILDGVS